MHDTEFGGHNMWMVNKLRAWVAKRMLQARLKENKRILDLFDFEDIEMDPTELAKVLAFRLRYIKADLYQGLDVRDYIGFQSNGHVENAYLLRQLVIDINNAAAEQQFTVISSIQRDHFVASQNVAMPTYMRTTLGTLGEAVSLINELITLLQVHVAILDTAETGFVQRQCVRMYYDIVELIRSVHEVTEEKLKEN